MLNPRADTFFYKKLSNLILKKVIKYYIKIIKMRNLNPCIYFEESLVRMMLLNGEGRENKCWEREKPKVVSHSEWHLWLWGGRKRTCRRRARTWEWGRFVFKRWWQMSFRGSHSSALVHLLCNMLPSFCRAHTSTSIGHTTCHLHSWCGPSLSSA